MLATVKALAAFERESASDGERRAAEWIAARLREHGWPAEVEVERAHGGYWWPLAIPNALAAAAALLLARRPRSRTRRALAAAVGAAGAAAVADDVGGGRLWLRRVLLPHRDTWNVVAERGDPNAARTIVLIAHHDAAHSGLVFHPALPRVGMRLMPGAHERSEQAVPVLFGVFLGPALLAAAAATGSRLMRALAAAFGIGASAAMADIARSQVVAGANDNLSAVAVLLELAGKFRDGPPPGVRLVLVSTGSEESFSEGMQGFLARHGAGLPRATTEIVALECLGGSNLLVLDGEGMLRMRRYEESIRAALTEAAASRGIQLGGPLRTVAATDALPALRRGWRTAALASVDDTKLPRNYHWPTDIPEALDTGTMERALAVCEAYVGGVPPPGLTLEMTRVLPAGPSVVFAFFSDARRLARWWGPTGFSIPALDFEPRAGASYRIEMQPPEGASFHLAGDFREVDPPTRLAFTFRWEEPDPDDVETGVQLSFRDLGDATEVALVQGPFKTGPRFELHRGGWTDSFDKLEALL